MGLGVKLAEIRLAKRYANLPAADLLYHEQIADMITEASDAVERFTDRQFTYGTYRDFCQSYNQDHFDPVPQFAWVDAFPIDVTKPTTIVWAPYELHDQAGITLIPNEDYTIFPDKGCFRIRKASGVIQTILPLVLARPIFQYSPDGFRVDYTGGYPVSTKPVGEPVDPTDDYGVVQVPNGLKNIIAQKVGEDWKSNKQLKEWTTEERAKLRPYMKKNRLLGS